MSTRSGVTEVACRKARGEWVVTWLEDGIRREARAATMSGALAWVMA